MVAAGTVDEDIYSMGERKKELNKSVLNDAGAKDKDVSSTISGTACSTTEQQYTGIRLSLADIAL